MQTKQLPNLGQQNARLAGNNGQVIKLLDGLTTRIDAVVQSTVKADWNSVRALSEAIASDSRAAGAARLADCAERVHIDAAAPENVSVIKKSVIRLLSAFGKAKVDSTARK